MSVAAYTHVVHVACIMLLITPDRSLTFLNALESVLSTLYSDASINFISPRIFSHKKIPFGLHSMQIIEELKPVGASHSENNFGVENKFYTESRRNLQPAFIKFIFAIFARNECFARRFVSKRSLPTNQFIGKALPPS